MSKSKSKYYSIKKFLKLQKKSFNIIISGREAGKSDLISRAFDELAQNGKTVIKVRKGRGCKNAISSKGNNDIQSK